ncbi:bifunctional ADP-dependent NAD(P)H-hydrate dehydratase/NAD(P)H-hydrate epimerase [Winogradskyella jejuensis]|uniref:Bifunctional NAD(P)H-hydrate repair enzyme n=1 Tax=Winogradskyella jejuensis TaxID=1089305 RepID=A0A1M5UNS9_9FLAO|nr:bifunctional ADP-dependent NAD(P)H-hydrate dehydratase/NAD(P)H-hydrate epimerase [Winogradskyella jejuensis]SHH64508.1 yjeF C-terminal region, hydroxyethylthiazole kinase-related/yjeF N-terminal region [Winogradskyella jejuensis]
MKIFSKTQIYEGDKITEQRQSLPPSELMERAGLQIFNWMHLRMQGAQVPIHIFCGIGNNGGDGLVIARHLITHGYNVEVYVVNCGNSRSQDFLTSYDKVKAVTKKWPQLLKCETDFPEIHKDDIIVDAIFGIGLNRSIEDWIKALFHHFKASDAFTLSVDIPSGWYTDKPIQDKDGVVRANYTLSFQSPKLIFFLPETSDCTVQWEVIDIGIDREYLISSETEYELISKNEVLPMYKPREKFSHKGDFGHGLIIGGSYGKIGAVQLATRSVLSSGAGLATAYVPKCGYYPLQSSLPEAMVIANADEKKITDINFDIEPSAIGIGVGLGKSSETVSALQTFLKSNKAPLVIDADAINIISENNALLKSIPENSILTPHPKELERLVGKWSDDFDKLKKASDFSVKHKVIVVIKGAHTITVFGEKKYINVTGNPGMATGGSGDVLTGVITGLLCQKYNPIEATLFGVYLHGRAGDLAIEEYGYQSLLAGHIIDYLGEAYIDLFKQPEQTQVEGEEEVDEA